MSLSVSEDGLHYILAFPEGVIISKHLMTGLTGGEHEAFEAGRNKPVRKRLPPSR